MKTCDYCGLDFEHNPEVCRVHLAERKVKKIHHFKPGRKNGIGNLAISRKNILELADYINGKKV